jgi:hypothetical protein
MANITMNNTRVCRKKPDVVGQPLAEEIGKRKPRNVCDNIYVSGLATRKKTRAL